LFHGDETGAYNDRKAVTVFKSIFVPILTCGHESQLTTESILSKEQMAEMGYLRRALGVTNSTVLKSVKSGMSSHLSESKDPSYVSSAMYPECPRKEW